MLAARGLALSDRIAPTDLALDAGTLTCLIAPNGGGKTSLLHAIAGVGEVRGHVEIAGRDLRSVPPSARARWIGYLPTRRTLAWPLLGGDVIALGGADAEGAAGVIADLALEPFMQRKVTQLSTGERTRVLLARVLAPRPKLLLLDEPTANLDLWWQLRLMEVLRAQVQRDGSAALVAMHDIDAALRFADRLLVMAGGRIVADGAPAELGTGDVIATVFGVRKAVDGWTPVFNRPADPQSLP